MINVGGQKPKIDSNWLLTSPYLQHCLLSEKGLIQSNHKTVANKFNDSFTNVAQNLLQDLGESNSEFQNYLKNTNFLSRIQAVRD